jgi:serine/threonine protein kinase
MAEVFEAELAGDLGFVRKVAIKRMLENAAADPVAARRFLDEASIASRLHHANVISVVDLGLLDERPFQVLEYVDGIDAHRLLQRAGGSLPIEVALALATAVAHALDHAHTAVDATGLLLGIVHRDVKPSNVLVSWSGDVKLGDFGIAVARDREATTEAGVVAGTVGFIAPEQRARGELDGRTDVFALGLTLHALITGSSPLSNLEQEMRALAGDPVPIAPAIPAELRPLLASALALSRVERPTAAQLATQLGALLAPRLVGDSRSMLREFLAKHDTKPAPARGALDALLGIEVVMTGGSRDEVPRYETRAASPSKLPTTPHERATTPEPAVENRRAAKLAPIEIRAAPIVPRDAETKPTVPIERVSVELEPPGKRRIAPIAVGLIGVAGLAGLGIWKLIARGPTPAIAIDASDRVAMDVIPPDGTTAIEDVALSLDTSVAVLDAAIAARDANRASPQVRDAAIAPLPPDATPPPDPGTGYIQVLGLIGGEDVIGAAVIVDGKQVGFVPNTYPLTVGKHVVEIERRDGTRLPPRTIEIKSIHSRGNPLKPTW